MQNRIRKLCPAGYPGIYLVSSEEGAVEAEMKIIAESLGPQTVRMVRFRGLVDTAMDASSKHKIRSK